MNFGKRLGWFGMCLLVLLIGFILQIVGSFMGVFAYSFVEAFKLGLQGITDVETITAATSQAAMDSIGVCLILAHLLMILCFTLWYYYGCGKPKLKNVKGILAPKNILVILLISVGMCYCTNFMMPVASLVIPESIMTAYEELMEQAGFGVTPLAIIASVLLAPFSEEFLCRGVIFYYAKKMVADMNNRRKAFWIANTVQALMFGILHGNLVQGTYAFFMGLALGYLAHRYRSLIPSIIGHMLVNAVSSYAWEPIANVLPESYVLYGVLSIACLIVVFVGMYIGGPAEKNKETEMVS